MSDIIDLIFKRIELEKPLTDDELNKATKEFKEKTNYEEKATEILNNLQKSLKKLEEANKK